MLSFRFFSKAVLSGLLVIAAACGKSGSTGQAEGEGEIIPADIVEMRFDQIRLAGIDTGHIVMKYLGSSIKSSGLVVVPPQNFASVSAPLGGFIKTTSLLPGNPVSRGQVLATIENQEFIDLQEHYLEAKNRLEYADAEYKRHSELFKEDVYSEKNFQQVATDYRILKAQVSALEQKLALVGIDASLIREDNITRTVAIVSPISGIAKTVNVNTGKSVSPSDVLFEIVNTGSLLLELTLFEKDASRTTKGQKIKFYINNETEEHEAEVYQSGGSVNSDKTYKVFAIVKSDCRNVLPGMYVSAFIETSGNIVTSVPSEAIVTFEDKDYIFTFARNKEEEGNPFTEYRIVEVRKGISDGGSTEVILPAGFNISTEKIVIKGAYNLLAAKKNAGEMAC
ncbi:MAG: efflux RND transporter periplasmic adaptor subunit [Bacteroidales bacterium]